MFCACKNKTKISIIIDSTCNLKSNTMFKQSEFSFSVKSLLFYCQILDVMWNEWQEDNNKIIWITKVFFLDNFQSTISFFFLWLVLVVVLCGFSNYYFVVIRNVTNKIDKNRKIKSNSNSWMKSFILFFFWSENDYKNYKKNFSSQYVHIIKMTNELNRNRVAKNIKSHLNAIRVTEQLPFEKF